VTFTVTENTLASTDAYTVHYNGLAFNVYTGDTIATALTAAVNQINTLYGKTIATVNGLVVTVLGEAGVPTPLIGITVKGNGTTATANYYNYFDYQKSIENTYYRLADVSTNNTTTFSQIISSTCSQNDAFEAKAYPTPAQDYINIKINRLDKNASFSIIDRLGRIIKSGKLDQIQSTLDIHKLSSGFYFLQINSSESNSNIKFEKI
jgi:hypothetical protein